jgi:hypothetical protein
MRVSRRTFILSGLLSVSGLLYWKTHTVIADDIELFFSNYESVIPIEDVLNTDNQISLFEEKLLSMLASIGVAKTISVINQMIKDEYQPTFTLKNMKKDLDIITQAAKDFGAILPMAEHANKIYSEALEAGLGEIDYTGILAHIKKKSGD